MDAQIGLLFSHLDEEVAQLFYRWKICHQLFSSGKENLNLLNQSGSNVFALLHGLIIENVFLTLSRLTDPERIRSHENLGIRSLLARLETTLDDKVRNSLRGQLTKLEAATETLRSHRNKRIAHLDLNNVIKLEPLPSVEYGDLENALELLESIMRDLRLLVWDADTDYRNQSIAYGCDGEYLLCVLRQVHNLGSSAEE